jgi:hypothetical protein
MGIFLHWYCLHLLLASDEKGPTIKYRKTPLDGGFFKLDIVFIFRLRNGMRIPIVFEKYDTYSRLTSKEGLSTGQLRSGTQELVCVEDPLCSWLSDRTCMYSTCCEILAWL